MTESNHLHILWTSGDKDTAINMVLMYASNSMIRGWWQKVTVVIWGASQKLTAEDEDVQTLIRTARQAGVEFTACIACANNLGSKEALDALGVTTIGWGAPLTELLKTGQPLITV